MKSLLVLLFILFTFQGLAVITVPGQQPELVVQTGHTAVAQPIGFSQDGKILATTSMADETVKLWDVATGRELKTLVTLGEGLKVSKSRAGFQGWFQLSPDGRILATGSETELITLWDMATGHELTIRDCSVCLKFSPFAFSPDSKMMVPRMLNGWSLTDLQTGNYKNLTNSRTGNILGIPDDLIGFSPDGKTLAFRMKDKTVKLWKVAPLTENKILNERIKGLNEIAFSPDGKTIVAADKDRTIKIFNVTSEQELKTLMGNPSGLTTFSFSPDGKILVGSGEQSIKLWSITTGEELRSFKWDRKSISGLTPASFSADGTMLVAGGEKVIKVWSVTTGEELKSLEGQNYLFSLGYSPDGRWITSVGFRNEADALSFTDYTIKLWDLTSGKELVSLKGCTSTRFSADGNTLASGCTDGSITISDARTGQELRTLNRHSYKQVFVAFSSDGKTLASTTSGGVAKNKFEMVAKDFLSVMASVFRQANPSNFFALGNENRRIRLLDLSDTQELKKLQGHTDIIRAVMFSPDGEVLASASEDTTVKLWSKSTGQELRTLKGHAAIVSSVAFSPDSKILASGSYDGTLKLWDVAAGKELKTLKVLKYVAIPMSVSFSSDGKMLAAGYMTKSMDKNIVLWNVATGHEIKTLEWRRAEFISAIAFSTDGTNLVARSAKDGVVKIWEISSGQELKTLEKGDSNTVRELLAIAPEFYRNNDDETVTPDGRIQITRGSGARLNFTDIRTGKLLASLITLDESDWAVVTPEGRFDTNKLAKPEGLHWLLPDAPLTPLSFEVFMRDYFEPKLLVRLLKCTKESNCDRDFKPVRNLSELNRTQPNVKITKIMPTDSPDTVEVSTEVENVVSQYQNDPSGEKLSSGVYDLRLFRDGQLVAHSTSDEKLQTTFRSYKSFEEELVVWREAHAVDLLNGKKTFTFRIKLPYDQQNKPVEFSAYAFNNDRVKSETAVASHKASFEANLRPALRRAYVITFGASKYDNPEWDLQFAGNDAQATLETVSANLRAQKTFSEVVEVPLISDKVIVNGKAIHKRDATKGNVQTVLELLGRKMPSAERLKNLERAVGAQTLQRIRQADPDDMVLIAFSSHGYANKNGIFYIVPTEIGKNSKKRVTPELLSRSISSDEISLWLRDVDAGEIVMIVDACHASSAVEGSEFKPGPMGSRGLGQLAFDKGMKILAATQSDNVALENNLIKHGLLTYALVKDGIGSWQADYKPKDKIISSREWLAYGVERVPKLYEEIRDGRVQRFESGAGGQTKIVLAAHFGKKASKTLEEVLGQIQQPSLFDFARNRREVALVTVP